MSTSISSEDRRAAFEKIKQYFAEKDRARAQQGKLSLGSTEKGFWGVSHLDDVYAWAEKVALHEQPALLDLGSGDGRVVLVTALFTPSTGIEYDLGLHELAVQAAADLQIPVTLVAGDYTQHDLSQYRVLFAYADHNWRWLEVKRAELTDKHELHLYHDTFHPEFLTKGKTTWIGQIPIFLYTTAEKPSNELDNNS